MLVRFFRDLLLYLAMQISCGKPKKNEFLNYKYKYKMFRDSQESILGMVVCLLVFSGGDSLFFFS